MPPQQDRLKALLNKVGSMNLGAGGWWKAAVGTSTIRILPAVGTMDYFFVEVGLHYMGEGTNRSPFYCPSICTEGQQPCPICEVNEELFKAGEKDAASKFRAGRSFYMNVVDRAHPDQGVLKYAPGTTIFASIASMIQDPDYGDISDAAEGFDIKIERTGEGRENTRYQVRPVRRSTPLGDDGQAKQWLKDAEDLKEYVAGQLLSYEELIKKSGIEAFFSGTEVEEDEEEEPQPVKKTAKPAPAASKMPAKPAPSTKRQPAPEPDEEEDEEVDEEEDEEPPAKPSVSQAIGARMTDRERRAQLLKRK